MRGGREARALVAAVLAAALSACASAGGLPSGPDALPPIPHVRGPLEARVIYPDSLDRIAARDSNFVLGTTGTGEARLWIDGSEVEVRPNGSFLAWLPVPERVSGDTTQYRLVAEAGGEADTLVHRFLLPPEPGADRLRAAPGSPVWVDTAGLASLPERWALPDERLELRFRAAPGLEAWLAPGRPSGPDTAEAAKGAPETARAPTEEGAAAGRRLRLRERSGGRYVGRAPARELVRFGDADTLHLELAATDGRDTVRAPVRVPLRVLGPDDLPVAELSFAADSVHGDPGLVVGRPLPHGSYHWSFPDGTRARVDGREGDRLRLLLSPGHHAWVTAEDARVLPGGVPSPESPVGTVVAEPGPDRVTIRLALADRLPARVDQPAPRTLRLTLYGASGGTERMLYGPADPLLRGLEWEQASDERYRLEVRLSRPVWGYRLRWAGASGPPGAGESGDGAGTGGSRAPDTLLLEVRRPPRLDEDDPLDGVRVAVDPGHPPVGATGPTGLEEAEANLAVAGRLAAMLREAGAEPVLLRTGDAAVGLYERRLRARDVGADLFVSIHNNALPDGLRPFGREGTSTYYFQPHSRELAREVQAGMLRRMGLRDLGVRWGNLAVPRTSWTPTVLTEGAFMMFPRHEAALRTESFQRAYARGMLEGIRAFLRRRARDGSG